MDVARVCRWEIPGISTVSAPREVGEWRGRFISPPSSLLSFSIRPLMATLDSLKPGSCASIVSIEGHDAIASRLLEMGLIPGTRIEFLGRAPLGDPLQCFVRGFRLALRNSEARRITVDVIDDSTPHSQAPSATPSAEGASQ